MGQAAREPPAKLVDRRQCAASDSVPCLAGKIKSPPVAPALLCPARRLPPILLACWLRIGGASLAVTVNWWSHLPPRAAPVTVDRVSLSARLGAFVTWRSGYWQACCCGAC